MNDEIRLRPMVEADLDLLEYLFNDPAAAGDYGWFGYRNPGSMRQRFAAGLIGEDHGSLAIEAGGRFAGEVQWHPVRLGPGSQAWNLGISLLPDQRGRGYGTRAQRLLAEYLFAHTQVNRVEAGTEVTNLAEQRSLEKAGFTREGVQRGACFRDGAWRDMVCYSILRAEVELG